MQVSQAGAAGRYHRVPHASDQPEKGDVVVSRRRQGQRSDGGGGRHRGDAGGLRRGGAKRHTRSSGVTIHDSTCRAIRRRWGPAGYVCWKVD